MSLMTHEVTLDLPYSKSDCFAAAKRAIEGLGHKIISENEIIGTIQASVKMTFTSGTWGDILTVTLCEGDGRCKMTVNSTAKSPTLMAGRQQTKNVQVFSDVLSEQLSGCQQVTQQEATAPATSAAAEIKAYKELLDMGAITQDEYDQKKKQLLGL